MIFFTTEVGLVGFNLISNAGTIKTSRRLYFENQGVSRYPWIFQR